MEHILGYLSSHRTVDFEYYSFTSNIYSIFAIIQCEYFPCVWEGTFSTEESCKLVFGVHQNIPTARIFYDETEYEDVDMTFSEDASKKLSEKRSLNPRFVK
jgi:hypothetical protein